MNVVQAQDVNGRYIRKMNGQPYLIPAAHANLQFTLQMDDHNNPVIRNDGAPVLVVQNPLTRRMEIYNENNNYGNNHGLQQNQTQGNQQWQSQQPSNTNVLYDGSSNSSSSAMGAYGELDTPSPVPTQVTPTNNQVTVPCESTKQPLFELASESNFKADKSKAIVGRIAFTKKDYEVYLTTQGKNIVEMLIEKGNVMKFEEHTKTQQRLQDIMGKNEGTGDEIQNKVPLRNKNDNKLNLIDKTGVVAECSSMQDAIASILTKENEPTGFEYSPTKSVAAYRMRVDDVLPIIVDDLENITADVLKEALDNNTPRAIYQDCINVLNISSVYSKNILYRAFVSKVNSILEMYRELLGYVRISELSDFDDLEEYVADKTDRQKALDIIQDILDACKNIFGGDVSFSSWEENAERQAVVVSRDTIFLMYDGNLDLSVGKVLPTVAPELFNIIDGSVRALEKVDRYCLIDNTGTVYQITISVITGRINEYYVSDIETL